MRPRSLGCTPSVRGHVVRSAHARPRRLPGDRTDEAEKIFEQIRRMGESEPRWQETYGPMTAGILRGIEDGWFTGEIADAAFAYQQALEKGDKKMVGVNCHTESTTAELEILRISHEIELDQRDRLAGRRAQRDQAAVDAAIAAMVDVARGGRESANLIEPMLAACRAEATLGEICDALRAEWGVYTEPARF